MKILDNKSQEKPTIEGIKCPDKCKSHLSLVTSNRITWFAKFHETNFELSSDHTHNRALLFKNWTGGFVIWQTAKQISFKKRSNIPAVPDNIMQREKGSGRVIICSIDWIISPYLYQRQYWIRGIYKIGCTAYSSTPLLQ